MFLIKDKEIDINPVKRASNEYGVEHWFDSLFDEIGLSYQAQYRILNGKPDCLIGDIIIDFKYKISDKNLTKWVNSKGKQYIQEYFDTRGKFPSLLIVISESYIWYYDIEFKLRKKREINEKSIKSLIECLLEPKSLDSEQFAILFGVNSPLYILSYSRLEKHFEEKEGEKTICFQQWKKHFRLAYHDEEVGKELFLRHSYLSMLLKLILYKEFINPDRYTREYFKDLENYFELLGISLFHYDFFRWIINVQELCDDYFEILKTITLKATDIFRTIYQEMIIAGVRHRLGEYYTPESLCKKMVEKQYELGDRVLDSSCGSGTFLIEIYKQIESHFNLEKDKKPPNEWFDSINNIFGFDINPIAVLTTKANCILFFKNRKEWIESISINIYLCNSIDPLEFSEVADIELGNYYSFCVDLLDDELDLRIPGEILSSSKIEAFQDLIKSLYNVWEDFNEFRDTWIAAISNKSNLKKNYSDLDQPQILSLYDFFKNIFDLKKLDKDHIWLYILNNLVGIRLLLMKKKMDLIVTNPPWLTYKDADPRLKETMKRISNKFNIKPGAKNITNIEEAVIFLYKIPDLYLKKDNSGKIAFVMPRSLLVSSQNQKARRFEPFEDIEFFEFNDFVFNIECCCMFAHYVDKPMKIDDVFKKYPLEVQYLDANSMEKITQYRLEPYVYFQKKRNEKYLVKKLIKSEKKGDLLPCHLSDYYNEFIQGADLIPKSLLYCNVIESTQNGKISIIDPWISPQAKGVWKSSYYKHARVETSCIFKATLSRQLYPFYLKPYSIFLPFNDNYAYSVSTLGPFSRKHWNIIKNIYKREVGRDLFEVGINYRNKLCTNNIIKRRQKSRFKVVFPNAKRLVAAVIDDPDQRIFVDSTLYYYGTKNEEEAYYLCGLLNISDLAKSVKIISDTRHHHKRPLYFNLPRFKNSQDQSKIAAIAKKCAHIVKEYILNNNEIKETKIRELIQDNVEKIQNIGIKILKSTSPIQVIQEYKFQ